MTPEPTEEIPEESIPEGTPTDNGNQGENVANNSNTENLPKTGTTNEIILYFAGMVLVLIGGVIVKVSKKEHL